MTADVLDPAGRLHPAGYPAEDMAADQPESGPLGIDAARDLLERLGADYRAERGRLLRLRNYLDGWHDKPKFSAEAELKFGRLWEESTANYLPLIVKTVAQRLIVQGIRSNDTAAASMGADGAAGADQDNPTPWRLWQESRLDAAQHALYRDVCTFGYAYGSALPSGTDSGVRLRFWSPTSLYAEFDEPGTDEYPRYAVRFIHAHDGQPIKAMLWDEAWAYRFTVENDSAVWEFESEPEYIGAGVCPFVRYDHEIELSGRWPKGEIGPLIQIQNQLNRVSFVINMIAEKTSFGIKWMAGVDLKKDENGKPVAPWAQLPGEIWTVQPGPNGEAPKIGQFSVDDPSALIRYRDTLRHDAFAMAQVPPTYGESQLVNVSAEGIAELEAMLEQKLHDLHDTLGEAHESLLRAGAALAGDAAAATDTESQVWWRDTTPKSLAQVLDAIVKAVQAGIPVEFCLEWLPNMSGQDLARAKAMIQKAKADTAMGELASRLAATPNTTTGTAGTTSSVNGNANSDGGVGGAVEQQPS